MINNERFKFILNNLTSNFTRFELQEFVNLKSEYSKKLYRMLKQYKSSGWWKVSVEEFNRILDVPKSYTSSITNRDILNPCIEELKEYFKNLTCEKIRASKRGKPIVAYEFSFDKEDTTTLSAPPKQSNNDILEGQISLDEVEQKQESTPTYKDTKYWGLLDRLDLTEVQIQDIYREMILKFKNEEDNEISTQYEFLDHCATKLLKIKEKQTVRSDFGFLKYLIANEKI